MSKRRKAGDWVWLAAGAGATGESNRLRAQIQSDDDPDPCSCVFADCDDPNCREWHTLWTEPDPLRDGRRHVLCHVVECQMHDEKQFVAPGAWEDVGGGVSVAHTRTKSGQPVIEVKKDGNNTRLLR
jgi:hypothetical protein